MRILLLFLSFLILSCYTIRVKPNWIPAQYVKIDGDGYTLKSEDGSIEFKSGIKYKAPYFGESDFINDLSVDYGEALKDNAKRFILIREVEKDTFYAIIHFSKYPDWVSNYNLYSIPISKALIEGAEEGKISYSYQFLDLEKFKLANEKGNIKKSVNTCIIWLSKKRIVWPFEFDNRKWEVGYSASNTEQSIEEYVIQGETIDNWSELYTVHRLFNVIHKISPNEFIKRHKAELDSKCVLEKWEIIQSSEDYVLYEWSHKLCGDWSSDHEISLVKRDNNNLLIYSYAVKSNVMNEDMKTIWLKNLNSKI